MLFVMLLAVMPCVTRSVLRVRGADEKLGWKIGELLRQTINAASADANHGGGNQFQQGLQMQLDEDNRVLVNPRVSEIVAKANRILPETANPDAICNRIWAAPCPDGWESSGESCIAPSSYTGACRQVVNLAGHTQTQKELFADDCQAPWPCADDCPKGHEYEQDACPQGWDGMGNGLCKQSGHSDSSTCQTTYAFGNMPILDRQLLAVNCGIKWPCLRSCPKDYRGCPQGWTKLAEICVAPALYAGECGYSVNISGMLESQKQAFALKCSAPFPCLGNASDATSETVASVVAHPDGPINPKTGAVVSWEPMK